MYGVTKIKILSLDQSTRRTGWAIFKGKEYITSGLIDWYLEKSPDIRFTNMVKSLYDLLNTTKPDFIIFEDVAYQRNIAALISLARLQGVLIGYAVNNDKDYFIYPASSWRSHLSFMQGRCIKRDDLKAQSIKYVKEHFGFEAEEDVAEGICIGDAFIRTYLSDRG